MQRPNRFAAVDTEVLLALEAGDEECQEAIDLLSNAGFYFFVTETPLQEIEDICRLDTDTEVRRRAKNTLVQVTNFGFLLSSLASHELGIAERVAHRLTEKHLEACEANDCLCLTEAAYNNCRFFLTRSVALLDSERIAVLMTLVDCDLSPCVSVSPKEIVAYFKKHQSSQPS